MSEQMQSFPFSLVSFTQPFLHSLFLIPSLLSGSADTKQGADRDETPPRTPTGNAPSSESDIEVSSPSNDLVVSQEEDERLAKELSLKEAAAHDLSHRPKRRRFHESYNFNMKCPTPGCNSLGKSAKTALFLLDQKTYFFRSNENNTELLPCFFLPLTVLFTTRSPHRETRETFLHIGMPSLPQSFCWWMQGTRNT